MKFTPFRHLGSVVYKQTPIQLTFFLTRRCNARCPFCFYLSRQSNCSGDAAELSLAEIEKMAASLKNLLWLAFSGGEVFLREDLVEIVNIFYERNHPAHILLPTNGLQPEDIQRKTAAILKNSPQSVVTVKLSLDGPEEVHDTLRGVTGAFQKAMETCRLLQDLGRRYDNFELGINSVFCRANQDCMEDFVEYVYEMDQIKTHTVSLVRGAVRDASLKNVDLQKYRNTVARLETGLKNGRAQKYRFSGARIKAAQDIVQRRLIHATSLQGEQVIPCYAGRLTLVVTETGDVFPCESFSARMGNVRESGYDMRLILQSPEAREALAQIRQGKCYCTHECYMMMNILFNPRLYPQIMREYLALPAAGKVSTPGSFAPLHS